MTSSQNPLQGLVLTPQQQNLLFAALNSNRPSDAQPTNGFNMSTLQFDGSPMQPDGLSSFQNSPDLDYDYDFAGADSSFDYYDDAGQAKMIGDLPGSKRALKSESGDAESPEKRSHPEDEEEEGPGAKRRESEEKLAKKPGRKPLTTEPTSVGFIQRTWTSKCKDCC
jgi:AP-1-like factor